MDFSLGFNEFLVQCLSSLFHEGKKAQAWIWLLTST